MPKKSTSKILTVRDASGDLHAAAARISRAMTGNTDYSAGVTHALNLADSYYKRVSKPIDYSAAPLDLLREYAVHGYDYTIRAPALAEIERRLSMFHIPNCPKCDARGFDVTLSELADAGGVIACEYCETLINPEVKK